MKKVVIFGGAGFIGRRLAACLSEAGAEVTVATRDRERAKADIVVLPGAAAVSYRPQDTLDHLTRGADVVVNLVGILHDSKRLPFEVAHEEFTRRLLAASARARVSHFVQMSALGAAPGAPSRYLRSKSKAERFGARCRRQADVGDDFAPVGRFRRRRQVRQFVRGAGAAVADFGGALRARANAADRGRRFGAGGGVGGFGRALQKPDFIFGRAANIDSFGDRRKNRARERPSAPARAAWRGACRRRWRG